jgi:hypothetical protein
MIKCPRCVQAIHRGAEQCPHCGFSIGHLDRIYGERAPGLERLSDGGGLLTQGGRNRVMKAMRRFERRFPQLWWLIHTLQPAPGADLRQFGFWLMNRGEVADVPMGRSRDACLVLAIDPDAKEASLSWGYLLDRHLGEDDTFVAMSRAHAYWVEARFDDGILRLLEEMTHLLSIRSRRAARKGGRA